MRLNFDNWNKWDFIIDILYVDCEPYGLDETKEWQMWVDYLEITRKWFGVNNL